MTKGTYAPLEMIVGENASRLSFRPEGPKVPQRRNLAIMLEMARGIITN